MANKSNRKITKRAIIASALAAMLCAGALVGTTFAWFTDTASTSVNTIQSGTLDIEITDEDGDDTLEFKKAEGHETEAVLWEPGATYVTEKFTVSNEGSLALKYKLEIDKAHLAAGDDAKLLDAIDFDIVEVDDNNAETVISLADFEGHLTAKDTATASKTYYLKGKMQESAGNEYQGLTVNGVKINVTAAQHTHEYDSTDNQYDANAGYATPVATLDELKTALDTVADGGTIALTTNITLPAGETLTFNKADTTINLDLGGNNLTLNKPIEVSNGAKVVINNTTPGTSTFSARTAASTGTVTSTSQYILDISGAGTTVDIYGGEFNSVRGIFVQDGATLTVHDAKMTAQEFCLNVYGYGNLIVNGGTFTSTDNAVLGTNGTKNETTDRGHNNITINGGTFNGNITTPGYIACGIYLANDDTLVVNGGTFNINGGVGVLVRSGDATINDGVVFNLTKKAGLTEGWVGDQKVKIPTDKAIVVHETAGYPGGAPTCTNNTAYVAHKM